MVAINFSPQFAEAVAAGRKTQTIRQSARAKAGQALQLYTGQRTKACRKLADAICIEIAEALCWTVDKAQRVIDAYLARRGVLAANAIRKLEDHRDKAARGGLNR